MTKDEFHASWSVAERRSGSILWSVHVMGVFSALIVIAMAAGYLAISFFIDGLSTALNSILSRIVFRAFVVGAILYFGIGFAGPILTGEKFPLNRDSFERLGIRRFWAAYQIIGILACLGLVGAYAFTISEPALLGLKSMTSAYRGEARWLALKFAAASVVAIAGLQGIHNWHFRWLTSIGMKCPNCGHFLHCHTGESAPPGCTNCGTKCRMILTTGRCDKCGHKIFDA